MYVKELKIDLPSANQIQVSDKVKHQVVADDFLNDLAELALGNRLKRVSEKITANTTQVYKSFDIDIQPKYFTLLALLEQKTTLTIVEAASHLGLSQPALSQFCKHLHNDGLIDIKKGEKDSRRREISLSDRGHITIKQIKPIWSAVQDAAVEMCKQDGNNFYHSLVAFENALDQKDMFLRTKDALDKQAMSSNIEILPFSKALAHHFESINMQWIEKMFFVEDIDKKVLQRPEAYIINKGGKIWFAKHATLGIVGTCALVKRGSGQYELTKMGVIETARGLKIGELLLQYVIEQALTQRKVSIFLLTNDRCEAAIHLYEKNGFIHDPTIMQQYGQSYERCNVAMRYERRTSSI